MKRKSKGRTVNNRATNAQRPVNRQVQMSRDEVRHVNSRKRRRKQKRMRFALYSLLLVCFLSVAVALSLTVFFKIGNIEITGSSVYGNTDIINASGIVQGDNLFLVNKKSVTDKITGTMPYVGEVKIKRRLPATLSIEVTETREYAAFDGEEGYILVNEKGKVLSTAATVLREDVAYISGLYPTKAVLCETVEFQNEETLNNVVRVLTAIKDAELSKITDINISDTSYVTLQYDGRITLKVGAMANIERKLLRAAEALKKEDARNASTIGTLDLTIDPYAYFREGKETTQPQTVTVPDPAPTGEKVTTEAAA